MSDTQCKSQREDPEYKRNSFPFLLISPHTSKNLERERGPGRFPAALLRRRTAAGPRRRRRFELLAYPGRSRHGEHFLLHRRRSNHALRGSNRWLKVANLGFSNPRFGGFRRVTAPPGHPRAFRRVSRDARPRSLSLSPDRRRSRPFFPPFRRRRRLFFFRLGRDATDGGGDGG
jgi:hypothetical protein